MDSRWRVSLLLCVAFGRSGRGGGAGGAGSPTDTGHPVPSAVVTLPRGAQRVDRRDAIAPVVHVIDQKNLMFVPYVQVFRPGDAVVFRNSDRTRHHVYSFSPAKSVRVRARARDSVRRR